MRRAAAILLGAVLFACATQPVAPGTPPVDWARADQESVVMVVTNDEDGDERRTKVWLVGVDGEGYLRTGETRWFANLERDPKLALEVAGVSYPMQVEFVHDTELSLKITAAFRAKYGFEDRMSGLMRRGAVSHMRLVPR
jgi:hypothetical protein